MFQQATKFTFFTQNCIKTIKSYVFGAYISRSNNLKEPYPAPCMTMHFPFICFTSLAAARIASCLTVSNVSFCVTAQPPSFTITSTSHLSAITTDEKAKCEICQACFFHPDSLVSLVPRVFFGHFSSDHPTRSRNMKQWRNNEVFITPFLLILKKNSLFHLIIPPKRTLFHELQISVTPFPSSGKPRHASSSQREFCYLWD